MHAARHGAILLAAIMMAVSAGLAPAVAQDSDEIYAINRRDAEQRAARRGVAPSRAALFPGFNLFAPARRDVPEITVRPAPPRDGHNPMRPIEPEASDSSENPGGPRAFCVRLCDGFYFPAGSATGGTGRSAQQATCNSLCPGTEVALYSIANRGTIEDATSARGQTYGSLRTAFLFRQKVENACTCHGGATNGLARLPITHDPTLRAGDIVVTDAGVRVFSGGPRFPYRAQDFVAARSYGRLPGDVQRRVAEIEAGLQARDAGAQAPVSRLGAVTARRAGMAPSAVQASLPVAAGSVTAGGVRVLDLTRAAEPIMR